MNPLNYATLEASRRLVAAGIVLETEASWYENETGFFELDLTENYDYHNGNKIPAHSMAEVWRELPDSVISDSEVDTLEVYKVGEYTIAEYGILAGFKSINPTDALIYLLIWVEEQKGKEN